MITDQYQQIKNKNTLTGSAKRQCLSRQRSNFIESKVLNIVAIFEQKADNFPTLY